MTTATNHTPNDAATCVESGSDAVAKLPVHLRPIGAELASGAEECESTFADALPYFAQGICEEFYHRFMDDPRGSGERAAAIANMRSLLELSEFVEAGL